MKKIRVLATLSVAVSLISGCSCSKVNESTYESAVNVYRNTDAISFTRIEIIKTEGAATYIRKKIDATYVFDANKDVYNMSYSLVETENNSAGGGDTSLIQHYYYSKDRKTVYSYSMIGNSQEKRDKYLDYEYDEFFNVSTCNTSDCLLMIVGNFAPIYTLDELSEFKIENDNGGGIATYRGICPGYESCASNSHMIDYTLHINEDGNIDSLSYEVVNGKTTYSIKYAFSGYGSNEVKVTFPKNLDSYSEKKRT